MLIDPSVVGSTSEPQLVEVEKGAIRAFARAIGDDNPLYSDEAFAREQGYASLVAPPTFPTTFRIPNPNIRLELSRVLHGEQEYAYERPIVAGDVLRCVNRVVDVYERTGKLGKMTFLVTEVRGEDLEGNPVFRGRSTIILR
ncbi:MaoC family dehydratase N-terminal domain-containing protein [Brevibacillus thermoruber]|jgi:acyl dehydratase|uniref:MaoC family dehydratase N-terminal domain-containing protein n=1 Tax=Brevibacillus thermoruber TaxID=33942 RepID=A0A9X3Z355_9BACL|nr:MULTISPECIES: MaoC family dehydratase N-terminal domain-containing protein [Brevibacillus]MDA5108363.1 MaoC family dehydratase N-terminal domain-containing protein [Brevibacillus thermoruber]